ncbi:nucleotidyltransferase family protein [Lentzea sp. BCCO 10_0856]|uniref:Nucleotidyltransferase family protein n=1 Tax=Lentzea miocenica TaxID=3095431 RepID=A0ABU4T6M4_9PSEU|nr:nucleotidyltransferase family protein [Lentzea sp. BCCO 10_0856]MDX8033826.1 nucleotidyltransferase family protein [Lentzea sp. BCCO 10_0856]
MADSFPELSFGYVSPRVLDAGQLLAAVDRGERTIERAADVIRRNRVVLIACDNLGRADHPTAAALLAELTPFAEERHRRAANIERSHALLDELATALDIGVWGIKGLSTMHGYPDPALREMRDVDCAVYGRDEAFVLARALRDKGFVTDIRELPWLKAACDGTPYGQYKLQGPNGFAAVDIHFGPVYSTGHCGLLPVPAPSSPGVRPLPIVANLRPMLGNSGGDIHITAKDVNDLWVASKSLSSRDISEFIGDARAAALGNQLTAIAETTLAVTGTSAEQRTALQAIACAGSTRIEKPLLASGLMKRTSSARVLRTATRAYRQAAAGTRSRLVRAGVVLGALAYYSAPLKLRLSRLPANRALPKQWRCVRLIPLSLAQAFVADGEKAVKSWEGDARPGEGIPGDAGDVRFEPAGRGHVVVSGDTVFVPTVWFGLPAGVIAAAAKR